MKLLFTEAFMEREWNGYIARHIKGMSGTHMQILYLAEEFTRRGHDVTIVLMNVYEEFLTKKVNGVRYVHLNNFIHGQSFDAIITTFFMKDFMIFNVANTEKIFTIMECNMMVKEIHTEGMSYTSFFEKHKEKVRFIYVSENNKLNAQYFEPSLALAPNRVLCNVMDMDDIPLISHEMIQIKKNQFVFFASLERGFHIAEKVLAHFPFFRMVVSNYSPNVKDVAVPKSNKQILGLGTSSRDAIFNCLAESKYFVYPLMLPNGFVHVDTFGHVVLEALLCGVIVIAPPMDIFKELYGDAICYLDVKGIIDDECLRYHKVLQSIPQFGDPLLPLYVEKIYQLESSPELRMQYIEKGLKMRQKFDSRLKYDDFVDFLQR